MTDKEVERLIKDKAANCAGNPPAAPELLYLTGVVKSAKMRIKKRQNIQFAIFIAVAVIVAAIVMMFAFTNIAVYIAAQLLPLALFCILRVSRSEVPR